MPRLFALDVDGTILDFNEELSPEAHDAIDRVRAAGHHVVIATGRDVLATLPVLARLGITQGWVVCSNGAVIIEVDPTEPAGFREVLVESFDPTEALKLIREYLPAAGFALERFGRGFWVHGAFPEEELMGELTRVDFDDLLGVRTPRVIVRSLEHTSADFVELIGGIGLRGVNFVVGWSAWLELAPQDVNKAAALERVRQWLDVPADQTVAVGDGRNDLEMFAWAHHAVAMGQSVPEVLAAADEITAPVSRGGLAAALRRAIAED